MKINSKEAEVIHGCYRGFRQRNYRQEMVKLCFLQKSKAEILNLIN
jgi:hypothetical protein